MARKSNRIKNAFKKCKFNVNMIRQLVFPTSTSMLINIHKVLLTFQKCNFNDRHMIWIIALLKLIFLYNSNTNIPLTFFLQHWAQIHILIKFGPHSGFQYFQTCNSVQCHQGWFKTWLSKLRRTMDKSSQIQVRP